MTTATTHTTGFGRRARTQLRTSRAVRARHPQRAAPAPRGRGGRLLLVAAAPPPEIETTAGGW